MIPRKIGSLQPRKEGNRFVFAKMDSNRKTGTFGVSINELIFQPDKMHIVWAMQCYEDLRE